MGMGAATASTQLPPPACTSASRRPAIRARTAASYDCTWRGVNAELTSRRRRVWTGGSRSIIDARADRASESMS